jgi:hypothetical protein
LDDDDPELLLLHFDQIKTSLSAFRSVANTQISVFQLSGEAMYGLRSCASVLHRRQPEQVIDETQIKELIDAVRELLDEVLASDEIDQQTKRYIRDRLKDVEGALIDMRITGTPGLNLATDGLIGSLIRFQGRIANTRIGVACAALAGKLLLLTATGNDIIDMAQHLKEIGK